MAEQDEMKAQSTEAVKSRIMEEIKAALKRVEDEPSLYDKGAYYKYGKIAPDS